MAHCRRAAARAAQLIDHQHNSIPHSGSNTSCPTAGSYLEVRERCVHNGSKEREPGAEGLRGRPPPSAGPTGRTRHSFDPTPAARQRGAHVDGRRRRQRGDLAGRQSQRQGQLRPPHAPRASQRRTQTPGFPQRPGAGRGRTWSRQCAARRAGPAAGAAMGSRGAASVRGGAGRGRGRSPGACAAPLGQTQTQIQGSTLYLCCYLPANSSHQKPRVSAHVCGVSVMARRAAPEKYLLHDELGNVLGIRSSSRVFWRQIR